MEISGWVTLGIAVLCLIIGYVIGQFVGVMKIFAAVKDNMKALVKTTILELKIQNEIEEQVKK